MHNTDRFDLKKNGKNLAQFFLCVSVLSVKNAPFDMGQRSIAGIIGGYIKPSNKIEFLKFITISKKLFFYATLNNFTHKKYRKDLLLSSNKLEFLKDIYRNIEN